MARMLRGASLGGVVSLFIGSMLVGFVACVGDDAARPAADGGTAAVDSGKTLGARCSASEPCSQGTCVDGFCCDRACSGLCEACDVAGKEGQCSPVTGKPHHGKCDGDQDGTCAGSCDGKTVDGCTYPTAACGAAASCAAGVATLPSTCQRGACVQGGTQPCAAGCFGDGCLGVKQIAAGYSFACAVMTDDKVRCWGDNTTGQIGQGVTSPASYKTPQEVPNLTGVKSVAATFGAACALMNDGTVRCWGSNTAGELGMGTADNNPHTTPASVPNLSNVTFLAGSSGGHFCAIVTGGGMKCWGGNTQGEIGDGTTSANRPSPTTVCAPGSTTLPCTPMSGATFVAGGDDHTCATDGNNVVSCWGGNAFAQLGFTADNNPHPFPRVVNTVTATYLTAGNRITCAASGGAAKCWGGNGGGRLGNGTNDTSQVTPVSVCSKQDCSTLLANVTAVSTYDVSVCALAGGAVKCWGDNTGGQLGDGNATSSQNFAGSTAVGQGAVQITSGGQTNYAIVVDRANRDVRCWGADSFGECGDAPDGGTTRYTPVAPKW
jgi:alpha-tubulin suppressor-like RCC1 family protein